MSVIGLVEVLVVGGGAASNAVGIESKTDDNDAISPLLSTAGGGTLCGCVVLFLLFTVLRYATYSIILIVVIICITASDCLLKYVDEALYLVRVNIVQ